MHCIGSEKKLNENNQNKWSYFLPLPYWNECRMGEKMHLIIPSPLALFHRCGTYQQNQDR